MPKLTLNPKAMASQCNREAKKMRLAGTGDEGTTSVIKRRLDDRAILAEAFEMHFNTIRLRTSGK